MFREMQTQGVEGLSELRAKIDRVDNQLRAGLQERFLLAKKIGELKQFQELPVTDTSREKEVQDQWKQWAEEQGLNFEIIEPIIKALIAASTSLQQK